MEADRKLQGQAVEHTLGLPVSGIFACAVQQLCNDVTSPD